MDLYKAAQFYVDKFIGLDSKANDSGSQSSSLQTSRIKVLLLDKETTPIISLCSTQSALLQKEIYLIDRIDNLNRDKMRHLKCVCFLRPSPDSIEFLVDELRSPKYSSYELFFSNTVQKSQLERLAESDDFEVVTKVQETFIDYLVINQDFFALDLYSPQKRVLGDKIDTWEMDSFHRSTEAIIASLLSLKLKPIIRYEKNSTMAKKLAAEVTYTIKQQPQLFEFSRKDTPPVLLILDRKNDPITPLLTPWTYQAQVHELIGIHNNRVDLSNVPNIAPELKEVVLSPSQDTFFKKSMYLNFGDLSDTIKDYVQQYQSKTKSNSNLESIADMKRFVEEYPEFRKLSGNVTKHLSLVSELDKKLSEQRLWDVSELEQSIACNDSHTSDLRELEKLLQTHSDPPNEPQQTPISDDAKIRLVAIYALRYEKHASNSLPRLLSTLARNGVPANKIEVIHHLLRYAGSSQRLGTNDNDSSIFARATSTLTGASKNKKDNVYMLHTPRLENILTEVVRGRLKDTLYPILDPSDRKPSSLAFEKAQDIIIYIVGGATYQEARLVADLNLSSKGIRFILGGTSIHSTKSFLKDIEDAGTRWGPPIAITARGRMEDRLSNINF